MAEAAKTIIRYLANGIDPATGEPLPARSPYNQPDVIRALFAALEALNSLKSQDKAGQANLPERHGKSWSEDERLQTIVDFKSGMPINVIATKLKRTKGSVWAILENHGLVKPLYHLPNPTSTQTSPQSRPSA